MAKKKRAQGGRPRKLRKPSQRNVLLRALRQGMTLEDASREAGVCLSTYHSERSSDKSFQKQIQAALLAGKRRLVRKWGEKKPDTLLAIRYPDEYARKDKYTLKQVDESVGCVINAVLNRLWRMIETARESGTAIVYDDMVSIGRDAIRDQILNLAIQGGEVLSDGSSK